MNLVKILIGLLLFVAISFGIIILLDMNGISLNAILFPAQNVPAVPAPVKTSETKSTSTPQTPIASENPTQERQRILSFQGAAGSPEERRAFRDLVMKNAQVSQVVTLGAECAPTPLAIRANGTSPVTVKNADTKDHSIFFSGKPHINIPAGETKTLDTSFMQAGGTYGYGCDAIQGAAGIIVFEK